MAITTTVLAHSVECVIEKPRGGNSFGREEADELSRAVKKAIDSDLPLVLKSTGRIFCGGGDLKNYASMSTRQEGIDFNRYIQDVIRQVETAPVATLAVVNGDCFGGGIELISAFDCVAAASHVLFGFWQRKIGLSYGWGGADRLQKRIGQQSTKLLTLSSQTLSADKALRLGLVDFVFHSRELSGFERKWLAREVSLSKKSIPALKESFPLKEKEWFEEIWMNADHKKVLEKFSSKEK